MSDEFKPLVDILKDRGAIYGDYKKGIQGREAILEELHILHLTEHKTDMTLTQSGYIHDIVNKLVRIAVTPNHVDSWQDIAGYASLVVKALKGSD